jgi:dipeptidyl aminopeptidase/acylaminoacyl peptidase
MKLLITAFLSLLLYGCNPPVEPTYEDSSKSGDPTSISDTLKGTIIYVNNSYPDRYSPGYYSSITILNLSDFSRRTFRQFSGSIISDFALSPDAKELAYTKMDGTTYKTTLFVAAFDTSNIETNIISSDSAGNSPASPNWTADNKLTYLFSNGYSYQLRVADGSMNVGKNIYPSRTSFSKNGTSMVFTSREDSVHFSLYVYNIIQTTSSLLIKSDFTYSKSYLFDPAISPDGRTVVFINSYINVTKDNVYLSGGVELNSIDIDGTNKKLIAKINTTYDGLYPSWSPDGKKIAYIESGYIYIINMDGTGKKKLSNDIVSSIRWIQ